MRDPQRLLEHGASESELALLRAGAAEEPSAAARQRLLASLGVSALASTALAQTAAAQSGAPAAAGGGALKVVLAKVGVKGLALALGGASVIGGAWVGVTLPSLRAAERAPREAARAPALALPAGTREAESTPPAQPEAENAAPAAAQSASPVTGDATPQGREPDGRARPALATASLAGEIAQLDRARNLLQAGDARAAAREIDRYSAEHPAGALRQEADVLRIDALWQLGERAQARQLSRAFLRAQAASPHAERVRARLTAPAHGAR